MSYTEMYVVRSSGEVESAWTFSNAFQGAIFVWERLCEQYRIGGSRLGGRYEALWARTNELAPDDRWVLASTYDRVIIPRESLPRLIEAFERFLTRHSTPNLERQLTALRVMLVEPDVIGVCYNQTSVNAGAWQVPDPEDEGNLIPYNINRDKGHWFLTEDSFGDAR